MKLFLGSRVPVFQVQKNNFIVRLQGMTKNISIERAKEVSRYCVGKYIPAAYCPKYTQ